MPSASRSFLRLDADDPRREAGAAAPPRAGIDIGSNRLDIVLSIAYGDSPECLYSLAQEGYDARRPPRR